MKGGLAGSALHRQGPSGQRLPVGVGNFRSAARGGPSFCAGVVLRSPRFEEEALGDSAPGVGRTWERTVPTRCPCWARGWVGFRYCARCVGSGAPGGSSRDADIPPQRRCWISHVATWTRPARVGGSHLCSGESGAHGEKSSVLLLHRKRENSLQSGPRRR